MKYWKIDPLSAIYGIQVKTKVINKEMRMHTYAQIIPAMEMKTNTNTIILIFSIAQLQRFHFIIELFSETLKIF